MHDHLGTGWLVDGVACIQLVDGESLRTDDPRFVVSQAGDPQSGLVLQFHDRQGLADLRWEVSPLDDRSATVRLAIRNRSPNRLCLERLDVLSGRVASEHDPDRRHVLLNGFVLSPPHDRRNGRVVTSLSSHETAALESPPLAAGWLTGKHNFGHIDLQILNEQPVVIRLGRVQRLRAARRSQSDERPVLHQHASTTRWPRWNDLLRWPARSTRRRSGRRESPGAPGMPVGNANRWPRIATEWNEGSSRRFRRFKRHFASRGATTMRICDDFIDYGDWPNKTKTIPQGFDRLARLIDAGGSHARRLVRAVLGRSRLARAARASRLVRARQERRHLVRDGLAAQVARYDEVRRLRHDATRGGRLFRARRRAAGGNAVFAMSAPTFCIGRLEPDRFHDPTMTKAEMLHAGMAAIRRGLGPDVFYRPINNPLGVAMGIANDTRISGDSHGDNPTAYFRTAKSGSTIAACG